MEVQTAGSAPFSDLQAWRFTLRGEIAIKVSQRKFKREAQRRKDKRKGLSSYSAAAPVKGQVDNFNRVAAVVAIVVTIVIGYLSLRTAPALQASCVSATSADVNREQMGHRGFVQTESTNPADFGEYEVIVHTSRRPAIMCTIKNTGNGTAYNVVVPVTLKAVNRPTWGAGYNLGDIPANTRQTFAIMDAYSHPHPIESDYIFHPGDKTLNGTPIHWEQPFGILAFPESNAAVSPPEP